ncbi:MAG: EAL domain-containing protein [Gammaproteobacteria bacterium]|nr:EAL domain-containing protein [Gammaproteobacteria bacterium]
MLLIAGDKSRGNKALSDVARELSLTLSYFASARTLGELMRGRSRRIVLLTDTDISENVATCLSEAEANTQFGVVVAADRSALRLSQKTATLERLANLSNVEWTAPGLDYERISEAARGCRRRMLRVSRANLQDAISNGEFILQYQPKVERRADWRTREAEALLRWRHPKLGLVGPLEFLPEIEAFDLMAPVSELVLREAAAQLIRWRNRDLNLNACINLASSQLTDAALADRYQTIVKTSGLECSRFMFEIAEQDLTDSNAPHLQTITALREKGFRLCLDNFRVAAASLGALEQLPFDEIKIHASALRRAQDNPVTLKVLAAVTGLAHSLGMSVCAEGVEDNATFEFLRTIECDKMQGFLISEAVMPDILRKMYGPKREVKAASTATGS